MGDTPFTIRNYYPDEFDNYACLLEKIEAHDRAGRYLSKQSLAENLGHPRFLPETNLFLARQDGDLIGYFSVFQEPEIGRALLDSAVHPSRRRKGIGTKLFDAAIRQAARAGLDVAQICISLPPVSLN